MIVEVRSYRIKPGRREEFLRGHSLRAEGIRQGSSALGP
jgi:hypothetical protein